MLCNPTIKKNFISKQMTLSIHGSTGSIGQSTLDIVRRYPEHFKIHSLVCGSKVSELASQAREFKPRYAVLADEHGDTIAFEGLPTELLLGQKAICDVAQDPEVDIVVGGISGIVGLEPILAALRAGKRVALANKESIVCGAKLLKEAIEQYGGSIIPVDSEHSSLFQCLEGRAMGEVASLIITASGGPFLHTPKADFHQITPEDAIKHPRWKMGPKICVDSATLMNKGLEVIEAHMLFGISNVEVLVHPQSIIHGMVSFVDGTFLAHLGATDMKGAIAYAIGYPHVRLPEVVKRVSFEELGKLEFLSLDEGKFPAVNLAKEAIRSGEAAPAVLSIANECAVAAFLSRKIPFAAIMSINESALAFFGRTTYSSIEDIRELENLVRRKASDLIGQFK